MKTFIARKADALSAHVAQSAPRIYDGDADCGMDRPAHVRAASSLVYLIGRFALVQDDANFLALVDPDAHCVRGPGASSFEQKLPSA